MHRFLLLVLVCLFVPALSLAQIQVTDADINGNVTWTADNVYVLNGFVFVENGESLTIEPGTVIQAKPGQGANASALIIARGGKIFADGNASNPIIFTAENDDVTNPNDIPKLAKGLWGGLLILGNAVVNTASGTGNVEGLPESERTEYGGPDDDDNSGILRYISIRHGGSLIGGNNEINGLTLAGVGRGTTIEHIEIFSNFDDGIEWFGGTAQVKYAISAFCGDDGFDYDEGWRGKGQFWLSIHGPNAGGSGGEHDGGTEPEDGTPYAEPRIYNATYIGSGVDSENDDNTLAVNLRDNAGGHYYNSIITDFPGTGVNIEDLADGQDSRQRYEDGQLTFMNNIWWDFGAGNTLNDIIQNDGEFGAALATAFAEGGNLVENPMLTKISRTDDRTFDPRPATGSPAIDADNAAAVPADGFFDNAGFVGAFNGVQNWTLGWTALDQYGYISNTDVEPEVVNVFDSDMNGDVLWSATNTYVLNGFVFVEDGESLTIEPGTVIQAKPGQGANASALIIARGGRINANGTSEKPIIFTAEGDDVNDPADIPTMARSLWGGLIVLGNARTNTASGTGNVEGVPESVRTEYGGDNDNDNSGILRYISIRHGGSLIGGNNEINGLTLGAVGSGTTIEYIEIFSNFDDGIEWFGGTAQVKYAAAIFCGDDGFDYDEGWRGKGQFWLNYNEANAGGSAGEHDGGTEPEDGQPYAEPNIYNATYIGSGVNSTNDDNTIAINMRDNAGGHYTNSIITDFPGKALSVEDLNDGEDSRKRFENGQLSFRNNIWWGFGDGNTPADFVAGEGEWQTALINGLTSNNNLVQDPMLGNIDARGAMWMFDPRPVAGSPALDAANVADVPGGDPFFVQAPYIGAFGQGQNWLTYNNWSAASQYGVISDVIDESIVDAQSSSDVTVRAFPNPTVDNVWVRYNLPKTQLVTIKLVDARGNTVISIVDGEQRMEGVYQFNLDVSDLAVGAYFFTVEAEGAAVMETINIVR